MSEGGWLCGVGSHDVPGTLMSAFVLVLFTEKKKRDSDEDMAKTASAMNAIRTCKPLPLSPHEYLRSCVRW